MLSVKQHKTIFLLKFSLLKKKGKKSVFVIDCQFLYLFFCFKKKYSELNPNAILPRA